jgi:hypothetical protein
LNSFPILCTSISYVSTSQTHSIWQIRTRTNHGKHQGINSTRIWNLWHVLKIFISTRTIQCRQLEVRSNRCTNRLFPSPVWNVATVYIYLF